MAASPAKASSSVSSKKPTECEDTISDTNLIKTIEHQEEFSRICKKTGNRLLLVEFFAKWCGPCRSLSKKLEELARLYEGRILIVKVDVDEFEELTSEFNILAVPTFIIMRNKKKLLQFLSSDGQHLEKVVERYAGKAIFEAAIKRNPIKMKN